MSKWRHCGLSQAVKRQYECSRACIRIEISDYYTLGLSSISGHNGLAVTVNHPISIAVMSWQ